MTEHEGVEQRFFETHADLSEYFKSHTRETNRVLAECYRMIVEDDVESIKPFAFRSDDRKIAVEVSTDEIPEGLDKLMAKAVKEEDYEVAAKARDLLEMVNDNGK